MVQNIHLSGGSLLGVSRGGPTVSEIVDSMEVRYQFFSFQYFSLCHNSIIIICTVEMLDYTRHYET